MKKFVKQILIIVMVVVITSVVVKATDTKIFSSSDLDENGCPSNMVYVVAEYGGFCMDRYEVSLDESCPVINPESQLESKRNIDSVDCKPISEKEKKPWRYISQNQAQIACSKVGKRLPTNKEWNKAALGTPDILEKNGSDDCQINKNWDSQPGLTGDGLNCKSFSGVFDMIGNVWEWTSETVTDGKTGEVDLPEQGFVASVDDRGFPSETSNSGDENYYNDYFWIKNSGTRGVARGGYWDSKERAGVFSIYAVLEPSFVGSGVGFRCVK